MSTESTILEQYKLYVEMADRVSQRRQQTNTFFLTINTLLVAFTGFVSKLGMSFLAAPWGFFIALAGLILCFCWYKIIQSYRNLNSAKYSVINRIEKKLPLQLFSNEWKVLKKGTDPKKFIPFTTVELAVPWVFFALHGIILAWSILKAFL